MGKLSTSPRSRAARRACVSAMNAAHPSVAKKGIKRAHHFAHANPGCQGNPETLMHLAAKAIIADQRRLYLRGKNGDQEVAFDSVEVEQQDGPYRVDLIGIKKNGPVHDRDCGNSPV